MSEIIEDDERALMASYDLSMEEVEAAILYHIRERLKGKRDKTENI